MNLQPMSLMELKQNYQKVQEYCKILNDEIANRNHSMALELYDKIYQEVFERYSRGNPLDKRENNKRKEDDRKLLEEIMEQTYQIMLELNFPEETA